jgi:hypothetical protein
MIRLLLTLYPESFRAQFSHELAADFADLRRTGIWPYARALAEFAAVGLGQRTTAAVPWFAGSLAAFVSHWVLYALMLAAHLSAESPSQILTGIEHRYTLAFEQFHEAKSLEDLDNINRWLDTTDWQSIVNGQPARSWADLRKYGFKGLWSAEKNEWRIVAFRVLETGGAEVEMRIGPFRVIDTWRQTPQGWRRSRHEKFPPR